MLKYILLVLLSFSVSAIECVLDKNNGEMIVTFNTIECCDHVEENTEEYETSIDDVNVSVLYLPFQEGIYLDLSDAQSGLKVSDTGYGSLSASIKSGKSIYTLTCKEEI